MYYHMTKARGDIILVDSIKKIGAKKLQMMVAPPGDLERVLSNLVEATDE